uniref:Uncharacterized protein n=1 Tax=Cutibacterium granulosum DSM 20700 TaxID=1160719 RepID=A0A9X5LT55_9ACTN
MVLGTRRGRRVNSRRKTVSRFHGDRDGSAPGDDVEGSGYDDEDVERSVYDPAPASTGARIMVSQSLE